MKTKIVFAGVMGAILMTAGANAATTSVATKGYVDQQVGTVKTTIEKLGDTYVTMEEVATAIENADLSDYQTIANISQTLSGLTDEQKKERYPSVAAVADAIENLDLGLTPDQVEQLQDLVKSDGVVAQLDAVKKDVATLKGGEDVEGSVAKSIADAISTHTTAADAKYQAQSTADFQIGTTGGVFRDMTPAEKAALASGVTAEKVADYDATVTAVDGLNGENGTIAKIQEAIDGLNGADGTVTTINKTVTEIQTVVGNETEGLVADVAKNTEDIAKNVEDIKKKITMPADCASGNKVCVLMVTDGTVSWTPVTSPVEDSATPEVTE